MIKKEVLDRLFRLKLNDEDRTNLYNILYDKLGKSKELDEINNKLSSTFSDLVREYLGEKYMNEFRKIRRITQNGNKLYLYLNKEGVIPPQLPDPDNKIKIPWYENYKLIPDTKKGSIIITKAPVICLNLDEDFPFKIFDKNGNCIIELRRDYNLSTLKDIEVFNINNKTKELIDRLYYLYLEYFKYYFINVNILRDTTYGSSRYNFLQYVSTWKSLYNINHEWMEYLYDYYTIGDGYSDNNIRFKYIEENCKDKIEELIKYILE